MSYLPTTGAILSYLGYSNESDYVVEDHDDTIILVWHHTDSKPTEQDILDNEQPAKDFYAQNDMLKQGQLMTVDDDARTSVGSPAIIGDRSTHDTWMQTLYVEEGTDVNSTPKPPPDERQDYTIAGEDNRNFIFKRYNDQWGWRWKMTLVSDDVTNLALYIQNSSGGYLYTTGALIDNGDGTWYTECPAGQADATPEDVYFHWILGAGRISSDFLYAGTEDELEGVVKFDSDYD